MMMRVPFDNGVRNYIFKTFDNGHRINSFFN